MVSADECSVIELAHTLGKKWTIPIVEEIYSNRSGIHFNGLLKSIEGITVCMLAKELNGLHTEGFVDRNPVSINNITYVNYTMTKKGVMLIELIDRAKELCSVCCPLGEMSCRYSRRRRIRQTATILSHSRLHK